VADYSNAANIVSKPTLPLCGFVILSFVQCNINPAPFSGLGTLLSLLLERLRSKQKGIKKLREKKSNSAQSTQMMSREGMTRNGQGSWQDLQASYS